MWNKTFATLLLVLSFAGRTNAASAEASMMQRLVYHSQGWGELGFNVAAHAHGKEPLLLRIGDKSYETGLGAHAPSETVFQLDGRFARFTAEIGVQPLDTCAGSVVFRVEVDGEERFSSGILHGGNAPKVVDVALTDASSLRLITEPTEDGLTCDMANWAAARLIPAEEAAVALDQATKVDIAPFARVTTWDPARPGGTEAPRTEPIPAEDLFLGTEVVADNSGTWGIPVWDGTGVIGLEWLERRRLVYLSLEFGEAPSNMADVRAQCWQMTRQGFSPGGSRWQGMWRDLDGEVRIEGKRWSIEPQFVQNTGSHNGTLKVRWLLPLGEDKVATVKNFDAYTVSSWADAELQVTLAADARPAEITLYNGDLLDDTHTPLRLGPGDSGALRVRYSKARIWELSDRTTLRFTFDGEPAFAVAVDDVVQNGLVHVPHAGVTVKTANDAKAPSTEGSTVLERVRSMPDQTRVQAMKALVRPEAHLGPTMLSLAADNRKFLVQREGSIQFDDRPEVYENHAHGLGKDAYTILIETERGNGDGYINRSPLDGWLPIPVLIVTQDEVEYRQTTFVAPHGLEPSVPEAAPWWLRYNPLGVAAHRARNTCAESREVRLALHFVADIAQGIPAELEHQNEAVLVRKEGRLVAVIDLRGAEELDTTLDKNVLTMSGTLAPWAAAEITLYMPRWGKATPDAMLTLPPVATLLADTRAYWQRLMQQGAHMELPDAFVEDLIYASVAHCYLAARNEGRVNIAPWIASWNYGPLESEAHSVIRGMTACGHTDFARRALDYYIARYTPAGHITAAYTLIGAGWHLWTVGEYYQLTRDRDWLLARAPEIERACRWIMKERRKTMVRNTHGDKVPEYGLMPPGVLADWNVYAYYFYGQGYYAAGLRSAGEALADVDYAGAEEIVADAKAFAEQIRHAYRNIQGKAPVLQLQSGEWVPAYPTHALAPCPIEHLYPGEDVGRSWCYDVELGAHHLVPFGILPPNAPEADWMINHMEDVQFLRAGWHYYEDPKVNRADWFNRGGFAKVQPYYARTGELHALRDDVKPFIRTYFNSLASLVNPEDLSMWEHFLNGAYNKTHETGYFLHQSRLMFARERDKELWLVPCITDQWLRDGMSVAFGNAPTFFGTVNYSIRSHVADGYVEAEVDVPQRKTPEIVVLRLRDPHGRALATADVEGGTLDRIDAESHTVHIVPQAKHLHIRVDYAPGPP